MEASICPACGGAFGERIRYPCEHPARFPIRFEEIALCNACGLGMALPRRSQAELDSFYAAGTYWNEAIGRSPAQILHERNQCRHRVLRAQQVLGGASARRVLDIGAGHGWTAHWLGRFTGRELATFEFIEPDDARSREIVARRSNPRTTRVASLDDARSGYNLIFLNHVLEHVADPVSCVKRVRSLLAPQGIAYFEVPYGDQRFKTDVFPHTWFFTPSALAHLAATCGVTQVLREAFGRMPSRSAADLVWRAAFRFSAALGLADLAGTFDDRIWRYEANADGMWLRWIVAPVARDTVALKPASLPV